MRNQHRSRSVVAALAVLVLAFAACTPGPSTAPDATEPGATDVLGSGVPATPEPTVDTEPVDLENLLVSLEPFATVPGGPLAMTAPDDGSGRLFVAAQDGLIWVVEADGTIADTPMVDLGDEIKSGGEQGLLGIAVHPSFPSDPRIFIGYTDNAGDDVVGSVELDPDDENRLNPRSLEPILVVKDFAGNHNGGAVLFGPEGYLYAFLGDGGGGGDPEDNGQDRNSLLGKVLRLNVDEAEADLAYGIPPDNPFVGRGGADEIWHWGLRNPWRASFDRATDDLWIGDVGQSQWEEINVAPAGLGGLNYGWNVMEATHCYGADSCDQTDLTLPVAEYSHELGCTVIGGYVYRGSAHPDLAGAYLFADYCSGRIFAIDATSRDLVEPVQVGMADGSISAFGEDQEGELYLLSLDGSIWRIVGSEP